MFEQNWARKNFCVTFTIFSKCAWRRVYKETEDQCTRDRKHILDCKMRNKTFPTVYIRIEDIASSVQRQMVTLIPVHRRQQLTFYTSVQRNKSQFPPLQITGLGIRSFALSLFAENRSRRSLKKSYVSDLLVILANCTQNERFTQKIRTFVCFWQFFHFLWLRANRPCPSLLIYSFLKSKLSDLLPSLITIERPWAIRSHRSFAHKKRAIRSKNRWANSQPWQMN